jgi:hypothetical protein
MDAVCRRPSHDARIDAALDADWDFQGVDPALVRAQGFSGNRTSDKLSSFRDSPNLV